MNIEITQIIYQMNRNIWFIFHQHITRTIQRFFSSYQWRYYTISTTWYYEMYSPTMRINCVSFKLNMNVLYQRKIIDKYKKTSNFDLGFPKFADRGKPSLGCQQPKMNVFSLWLNFTLIAHFCYSFCYSFFPFLAFFKIEETLRKIFWKNFKKLRSTLWWDNTI